MGKGWGRSAWGGREEVGEGMEEYRGGIIRHP